MVSAGKQHRPKRASWHNCATSMIGVIWNGLDLHGVIGEASGTLPSTVFVCEVCESVFGALRRPNALCAQHEMGPPGNHWTRRRLDLPGGGQCHCWYYDRKRSPITTPVSAGGAHLADQWAPHCDHRSCRSGAENLVIGLSCEAERRCLTTVWFLKPLKVRAISYTMF